jgi:hypothetical protein
MIQQGALLRVARGYVGQLEEPPGSNWSPDPAHVIRRCLALVGLHKPASWCAAFVSLCVYEANGNAWPKGFRPSARALGIWELNPSLQVGKDEPPEPEDAAIYDHGGGEGHIDIVTDVTSKRGLPGYIFHALGGNTNKTGARLGIGVFDGILRKSDSPTLKGFVRTSKLWLPAVA